MHYCGILICILSLIFAPCFARKASIQTSIQKIQESIRDTPLLPINDKSYKQFISKSPREYYAVVMLTATSKKYRCAICQNAKTTLEETAIAYHSQYNFNTSAINERIAFFAAEFDDCPQLFNELRLESVPHLYILPPTLESKPAKLVDHEVDVKALLEGPPSTFKLIEARTSVKVYLIGRCSSFLLSPFSCTYCAG